MSALPPKADKQVLRWNHFADGRSVFISRHQIVGFVRVPIELDSSPIGSGMSALGQKQTFGSRNAMSALPPKADIAECDGDVRFVPKADISYPRQSGFAHITARATCLGYRRPQPAP